MLIFDCYIFLKTHINDNDVLIFLTVDICYLNKLVICKFINLLDMNQCSLTCEKGSVQNQKKRNFFNLLKT